MKKYIREFYEQLYQGQKSARMHGLGGRRLALELGYPAGLIDLLPDVIWEDFLSCGNVLPYLNPRLGDRVLNLGSGAGVDSLALELLTGARLATINLDAALPVLDKGSRLVKKFFPAFDFWFVCADGESLPFGHGSFEWVVLNGVLNLFVDKDQLTAELYRVLKPGGIVAGADLCRRSTLPDYFATEPDAWAWCMSGAMSQDELSAAFEAAGFTTIDMLPENMDEYFDRMLFSFRKSR
jgi:SAM-dependent methyltransferase